MNTRSSLAQWVTEHALKTATLDPRAPLEDLEPLRAVIGDARVVAIGEAAHHVHEFYLLRHRLLRFLAERCGFTVYAFEVGFTEGRTINTWVQGGPGTVEQAAATGGPALGRTQGMYDTLTWMRAYNRTAVQPLEFTGVLPGDLAELQHLADYLRRADPDALPLLQRSLDIVTSYSSGPTPALFAYPHLDQEKRDALTANLSRLLARTEDMRADQHRRGLGLEHATALAHLRSAWRMDHLHRDLSGDGLAVGTASLEAFVSETVLRHLDHGSTDTKVVLALHNVHIRKTAVDHGGDYGLFPAGYHLAQALGGDYVAVAVTGNYGHLPQGQFGPECPQGFGYVGDQAWPPPSDGSIEAAFTNQTDELTVTNLRTANADIQDAGSFQRMRMEDGFVDVPVFKALDAVAYIPHTSTTGYTTPAPHTPASEDSRVED